MSPEQTHPEQNPNSHWLQPDRLARVSNLALPIIAGAVAMNLMGLIDTLMVGQLGDAALGGVGIGGQLFFLVLAVLLGLSAGVQATVARRVGEDQLGLTGIVLNGGVVIGLGVAFVLLFIAYGLSPLVFGWINRDPLVVQEGLAYLSTRWPSLLFIGMNLAFRSYWIGVSLAKWSMVSIISLSLANVLFNYLLIFGNWGLPKMDVAGAGLGSTLATAVGLLVNIGLALIFARKNGFLKALPSTAQFKRLATLSYPESLRQLLFSAGVVLFYVGVGFIGTRELAAFHVVISICVIAYLPHVGFGGAATTLVSETLGQGDVPGASRWGWQVSGLGLATLMLLSLGVIWIAPTALAWFLVDPLTLQMAVLPLQLGVIGHAISGYSNVLGSALIGAGATASLMRWSLCLQWLLFLPALAAAVWLGYGLVATFVIFCLYSVLTALTFALLWHRGHWHTIEV